MSFLNGYYLVNGSIVQSKIYAMLLASETKKDLQWCYYDDLFKNASKHQHSPISLEQIYKERAQQLRDSYDYLILNYSGGSDSHNILYTFLKNNIKLDHIYVQWPEQLMDKGIYTPNSIDKSNSNFHSEWDLVLKKDLEYIGKNYPNITIEIADWSTQLDTTFYNDDLFSKSVTNLPSIARAQKQNTFSKTEATLSLSGKKVCSIYGVDKPNIVKKNNQWFFYFVDTGCMAQPNPDNPNGTEYFYYTPNLPELSITQAFKMVEWYKKNPTKQYLITAYSERLLANPSMINWSYDTHYQEYHEICEIVKLVCYPNWDFNRFQAAKPFSKLDNLPMGVRAWDNILTVLPNFERIQQHWTYHWKSYLEKIDMKFMRSQDTVLVCKTKWHYLCDD
tara:strand:- start:242 stop:1414 length:1173 start_codon:yes stop_codon:yes gene_type:complete